MRALRSILADPTRLSIFLVLLSLLWVSVASAEPMTSEFILRDTTSVLRHLEASFKGNAVQRGYTDRELHFSLSVPLGALGCQLTSMLLRQPQPRWQAVLGGVAFGLIPGFAKEFHDMAQPNNYFSWRDVGYDVAGVLTGALIVWVAHRAFSRARLERTGSLSF